MKKVVFIAQFPPPVHGLSKAVETLFTSNLNEYYLFSKIDITKNKNIIYIIYRILFVKCDLFYFTISQSVGGNLRDVFFLLLIILRRKKCIIHLHGGYYRELMEKKCCGAQRWMNKKLLNRVEKCIVLGNSLKYIFEGYVKDSKICVVPNCIDDTFFPNNDCLEKKLKEICDSKVIHVVYLSNFIKEKGYDKVLYIAKAIKDEGKDCFFQFHFAGQFFNSEEKKWFEDFIIESGLNNVIYHGIVNGNEKNKLLNIGHVFILPTTYSREGQPISILEGMGNGMAIITTNHAGIPDISDSDCGFVCSKSNINLEDIMEFLFKCYKEREWLVKICRHNYQKIRNNYMQDQYIANMNAVFNEVLES